MTADKRAVLRRVRVFADLDDSECDLVLRVLKARRGNPGDVLFRQGDPGDSLMIVLEGQLVARVGTDAGGGGEVATLGPGEVVGEMSFIDAEPRSATVTTGSAPVTVLDFDRAALGALFRDAPRVGAAIMRNVLIDVARRLRDAGERLSDGAAPSSRRHVSPASKAGRGLTADRLRSLPAFADYGDADLELLAYIATLRTFAAGEVLMSEGAEGESCFLIASGKVSVLRGGAAPIATLGNGALVGQLALLDRAPRSATVVAAMDTTALELRGDAFENLVKASSPVALRFQWQVAVAGVKQLRVATQKVATAESTRAAAQPNTLAWDDWDDGSPNVTLELDIDPRARLRRT